MIVGGLAAATGGIASDLHLGGVRYDNTIRYFGSYGPVQTGLMHGLGSENGQDKMDSALLGYREGSVNAAPAAELAWDRSLGEEGAHGVRGIDLHQGRPIFQGIGAVVFQPYSLLAGLDDLLAEIALLRRSSSAA